jgi:hypothetical protein
MEDTTTDDAGAMDDAVSAAGAVTVRRTGSDATTRAQTGTASNLASIGLGGHIGTQSGAAPSAI